ncbi:uncharacterized protein MELLADRAFT_118331 [Melampsora larici-populina 98AG31]|uniref:Transcription activator of gluconeogenesis ERT1 n=1 Tax=Melampsora larici-populina (strain 98AG31 / pathotype 3-4-7) TaxID=747676 RepID=F4S7V1_MELLP|nr:uncharacterized protein MELLADRAFT_118331 [Melampsora larici-populina 98AG31]EGF99273.1 hypothetical protein MELLADRAFT_118331 [Melampsora larici-populina 98AG31]
MATQTITHSHLHPLHHISLIDQSHSIHPSMSFIPADYPESLTVCPKIKCEPSHTPRPASPLTKPLLTSFDCRSAESSLKSSTSIDHCHSNSISKEATVTAPKRKKANRACAHCQKAHLTCDDGRPCRRCTRRGLGASCADGFRKKAKYLRDYDDELVTRPRIRPPIYPSSLTTPQNLSNPDPSQFISSTPAGPAIPEPSFNYPIRLGKPLNQLATTQGFCSPLSAPLSPSSTGPISTSVDSFTNGIDWPDLSEFVSLDSFPNGLLEECWGNQPDIDLGPDAWLSKGEMAGEMKSPRRPPTPPASLAIGSSSSQSTSSPIRDDWMGFEEQDWKKVEARIGDENRFHELEQYLDQRFSLHPEDDETRAMRSVVANLRPELLNTQFSINDEDAELLERAVQRSLLELERMISVSGTPTVVWRRTGEVVCVGDEFCMLTDWSKNELKEKKSIFELFENDSVIKYFEKFDEAAFENLNQQVVMKYCGLICPGGRIVGCTFCFTIKRDLFNCPSLVIGNFLPILSSTLLTSS